MKIVAIGGTPRPDSSTERLLGVASAAAAAQGASVQTFGGAYISKLPYYGGVGHIDGTGSEMVAAVREADGILIASPGYHGTISGLMKNALDYIEDLSGDARVYFDGRPVGLIATAFGHQAAVSTLATLRSITHALRGWPTPLGAAIRTEADSFDPAGALVDESARDQLETIGKQVLFAAGRLA